MLAPPSARQLKTSKRTIVDIFNTFLRPGHVPVHSLVYCTFGALDPFSLDETKTESTLDMCFQIVCV